VGKAGARTYAEPDSVKYSANSNRTGWVSPHLVWGVLAAAVRMGRQVDAWC
jgi:hypothetical protein